VRDEVPGAGHTAVQPERHMMQRMKRVNEAEQGLWVADAVADPGSRARSRLFLSVKRRVRLECHVVLWYTYTVQSRQRSQCCCCCASLLTPAFCCHSQCHSKPSLKLSSIKLVSNCAQGASGEDAAKSAWSAASIDLATFLPSFANEAADVDKVLTQHGAQYLVA
jgi:hypothetical protein